MTKEIEYSRFITLEFQAYTGITGFDRDLFLDIQPEAVIVRSVIKHNISAITNTGICYLYTSLPIKPSNIPLFCIGQPNDYLQLDFKYHLINNCFINGSYHFDFILSGANGAPLLNADIIVVLEFIKYKQ